MPFVSWNFMRSKDGVALRGLVYFGNRTVTWNVKMTQPKGFVTSVDAYLLNKDGASSAKPWAAFGTGAHRKIFTGTLGSRRGGFAGVVVCMVVFPPNNGPLDLPCSEVIKPRLRP